MNPRRPDPPQQPRRCPICGVAMQASKSREDLAEADTFRCLSCGTTIKATPRDVPPANSR